MIFGSVAYQFAAAGKEDEIIGAVPLFDHVEAFVNFAAQVFVVKVPAQEDGFDHLAEFGKSLVGRMLHVSPGKPAHAPLAMLSNTAEDATPGGKTPPLQPLPAR